MLPLSRHQVLLVDDDDAIRDALTTMMGIEGLDVAPAWGVEDAYRQIRQGFRPCVVVLDLLMPGLDGWAFLDSVPTDPQLQDVPVIVISGDANQRQRALDRLPAFLAKPIAPAVLLEEIHRHCRRHQPAAG